MTAPKDRLGGYQQEIQAERDRKLEAAREQESPPAGHVTDETDYFWFADDSAGRWQSRIHLASGGGWSNRVI